MTRKLSIAASSLVVACALITSFASAQEAAAPAAAPAPDASVAIPTPAGAPDAAAAPADSLPAIPTKNVLQVLHDGGPFMIPIGLCSVVLLVFVFERALSLRGGVVIPGPFVERLLTQLEENELDREEALTLCEENGSPVAKVFEAGIKKWGRPGVEIEQAIIDEGERVANGLRSYLRLFNGIAQISPLLGLLGTVWGMIDSFNAIAGAGAMGRANMLAGGISQALLTTAAGLLVAIPALAAYLYFTGRVDGLVMEIDNLSQQLVEAIAGDAEPRGRSSKTESSSRKKAA